MCLPYPSCAQGLIPIQVSVRCQLSSGAIPTPSLKQPLPSIVPNGSLCFLLITAHVSLRPLVTCSLPDFPRHKVSSLRTAATCVLSAQCPGPWDRAWRRADAQLFMERNLMGSLCTIPTWALPAILASQRRVRRLSSLEGPASNPLLPARPVSRQQRKPDRLCQGAAAPLLGPSCHPGPV